MFNRSLIQFSVDGYGYVPSLLFGLRPTYGRVKTTSFRRAYASTVVFRVNPCLRQRLLDTHRQVWVSLLWGHCSFLLGPGLHKVLSVSSKSLFPQSCVSSGDSMLGLMETSSKRVYAIPRSTAPRAPAAEAVHCWPIPLQDTLKHCSGSVSLGSLGPSACKVCLSLLSISGWYGV